MAWFAIGYWVSLLVCIIYVISLFSAKARKFYFEEVFKNTYYGLFLRYITKGEEIENYKKDFGEYLSAILCFFFGNIIIIFLILFFGTIFGFITPIAILIIVFSLLMASSFEKKFKGS